VFYKAHTGVKSIPYEDTVREALLKKLDGGMVRACARDARQLDILRTSGTEEPAMPATGRMLSAEELEGLPDDGHRYELVNGELITMTPSGFDHGAITASLTAPLVSHVRSTNLGVVVGAETGFKLASAPDTVRAPDIAFIRRDRLPASGRPTSFWPGAPDLAVEVLSPSDTVFEVEEKVAAWLAAGSAVWVVNPKSRTVAIHRAGTVPQVLTDHQMLGGEDVVPGFSIAVADVFA
jgi:Uma2 family endonuclease